MLKFEFSKQFHAKEVQFFSSLLIIFKNGLVVKTLICFHEVLGSILDGCVD
jgi:hypothetical protein